MIRQLKYILAFIVIIGSYLEASTTYFPGLEANGERSDSILIGSEGGFNGFTTPSDKCKSLFITFSRSASEAEPNTVLTNDYTGEGAIPHLPPTIKHLYIMGDATDFATLVLGNTRLGPAAPVYAPSAYALPTPAAGTTIHFLLTEAPTTSPLAWFQGPLLANCKLVIEIGSAYPFINTVLPLAGGHIIIGAPVAPGVGFSALLGTASKPCLIQRHPDLPVEDAYSQAVMTLAETTVFPWAVNGISLAGGYPATFEENSDIVDPTAESAGVSAGYTVAAQKTLLLFGSHAPLPAIWSYLEPGGTSRIRPIKAAPVLPITSLKPDKCC